MMGHWDVLTNKGGAADAGRSGADWHRHRRCPGPKGTAKSKQDEPKIPKRHKAPHQNSQAPSDPLPSEKPSETRERDNTEKEINTQSSVAVLSWEVGASMDFQISGSVLVNTKGHSDVDFQTPSIKHQAGLGV